MAKTGFKSVDEYVASQPEAVQCILVRVRSAIRNALPSATEGIAYNMPSYSLLGTNVLHFAAWKQHYSLYPASGLLVAAFKDELAPYEVDKSTIRFPLTNDVPVSLIERIATYRANEVAHRETKAGPR
jgi:uncharacterized protein YdhG (YjbR/CyaY superfamily)